MQKCPYWCHTSLSSLFLAFGGRPQAHALFNVLYRWYFSLSLQKSNENAYDSQSNDDGLGGANKIRRVLSCIILPYDQPCVSMSLFMSVVVKFDIAIEIQNASDKKSKIGVFSSIASVGRETSHDVSSNEISRISLDIPVVLPYSNNLNHLEDSKIRRPGASRCTVPHF